VSDKIKGITLIMFLALLPQISASTYTLGSHQVSFNVSEMYNSSAKIDPPTYIPESTSWMYTLSMTPDTLHGIQITLVELPSADISGNWIGIFADNRIEQTKRDGIGGYKFSTMDFKGYPAYQDSYPAQSVGKAGELTDHSAFQSLAYEPDEWTVVGITAIGDNVPFQEILDTIKVTEAPTTPTKYPPYTSQQETKSFIGPTSAYAGQGKGAKPGMENQNAVAILGDSQSSNISVTAHGGVR
jgi:hypothetical protein